MSIRLTPSFGSRLKDSNRPLIGMWVSSGSSVAAEICAGAGLDWLLIDMEHAPNDLTSVLHQLQAVAAYPTVPVVRVPSADPVVIKQVLDLGAQNLLVPMISTPAEAAAVVAATRYPPDGVRGVGSALSRSGRWGRLGTYLADAERHISLCVQLESEEAIENASSIAATPGIDGLFVGPSDLAASMGVIGQQTHPRVVEAAARIFAQVKAAGKPVGINAFDPDRANAYLADGADFVLVGADVTLMARGAEQLAGRFIEQE